MRTSPSWPEITDIHCHLLPGIDDGSKCWEDSLQMARQAVEEGIGTAILTPHQLGNYTHNQGETIRTLTRQFQMLLAQYQIPLRVVAGADVRIDSDMIDRLRSGDCLTLADARRHVLLELPHEMYLPLEPVLGALRRIGLVGILSHPERNEGILRHPEVIPRLVDQGCLMQVTADSVTGCMGEAPAHLARKMIQQGWVHFLATDAHSPRRRRPRMREALQWAERLAGRRYAESIGCLNPAAVAAGQACPELPKPAVPKLFSRLFGKRVA